MSKQMFSQGAQDDVDSKQHRFPQRIAWPAFCPSRWQKGLHARDTAQSHCPAGCPRKGTTMEYLSVPTGFQPFWSVYLPGCLYLEVACLPDFALPEAAGERHKQSKPPTHLELLSKAWEPRPQGRRPVILDEDNSMTLQSSSFEVPCLC